MNGNRILSNLEDRISESVKLILPEKPSYVFSLKGFLDVLFYGSSSNPYILKDNFLSYFNGFDMPSSVKCIVGRSITSLAKFKVPSSYLEESENDVFNRSIIPNRANIKGNVLKVAFKNDRVPIDSPFSIFDSNLEIYVLNLKGDFETNLVYSHFKKNGNKKIVNAKRVFGLSIINNMDSDVLFNFFNISKSFLDGYQLEGDTFNFCDKEEDLLVFLSNVSSKIEIENNKAETQVLRNIIRNFVANPNYEF